MVHHHCLETSLVDMADIAGSGRQNMVQGFWERYHGPASAVTSGAVLWRALEGSAYMAGFAADRKVRVLQWKARPQMVKAVL
jgi:hypothetical protein